VLAVSVHVGSACTPASGLLRVLAAALELTGRLSTDNPTWYVVLQAVIGVIELPIATAMFLGYRRSGVWGEF